MSKYGDFHRHQMEREMEYEEKHFKPLNRVKRPLLHWKWWPLIVLTVVNIGLVIGKIITKLAH